jgi:cardiolipin synthase
VRTRDVVPRMGLVVAMGWLAGCAPGGVRSQPPAAAGIPDSASDRVGPDDVSVFTNGRAATAALGLAIATARQYLDAEIYEFDRPDLADGMAAAVARGVRVRILGDPTVAATVSTGRRLAAAGALVAFFPVDPRQIDHVKLLLVDGRTAFFGGVNWGSGSYRNQDYELKMQGPAVERLESLFAADLRRSGQPAASTAAPPPLPGEPAILTSYPDDQLGPALVSLLGAARVRVEVEMFVLTDPAVLRALEDAARRGVQVQALFDPGQDLNQAAIPALRDAGARCRFYRSTGEKLHAKAAVVDGEVLVVGSANWTASGFRHNHELDAVIRSRPLAAAVSARMDYDWRGAV